MKNQHGKDYRAYWLWAQNGFGAGSPKPWLLFRRFSGGLQEFYEGGPSLWNRMEIISEQEALTLYSYQIAEAEAMLEYCGKMGQQVLTPECEKYPEALRNIFDPPAVLYFKGTLPEVDQRPAIAVVGARKAKPASVEAAKAFGCQLASGGAAVVSGCAVGIDAAALMGAISMYGPVISVLPVSLDSHYIAENEALRREIVERGGALLTEYFATKTPPLGAFQVRNRIISGLCCGTLVIQAALRSGTLLTARLAKEQNRDVFVFPGPPEDGAFEGSRCLLEDGAQAVTCGEEILAEYQLRFRRQKPDEFDLTGLFDNMAFSAEGKAPSLADPKKKADLTGNARLVQEALEERPVHISLLEEKTGLAPSAVLAALTELELEGLVRSYPGRCYSRA